MIQNQISFWGQKDTVWQIARAGAKISPKSRKSPLWGWGGDNFDESARFAPKNGTNLVFQNFSFQQTSALINGTALSGWQQLVTTQCNIGEYLRWNSLPDLISQNLQLAAWCLSISRYLWICYFFSLIRYIQNKEIQKFGGYPVPWW